MLNAMREGGWGAWVVLLLGGVTLVTAVRFALKADPRRLAIIRALSAATLFASLTGACSGFMAVMHYLTSHEELRTNGEAPFVLAQGLGELTTVPTLGFMLLVLTWLFVAVGTRRLQDREV